jgi:hypothetical protein
MTFLLATLAAALYAALVVVITHQSAQVIRLDELGTRRSKLLFPLSNTGGCLDTPAQGFLKGVGRDDIPIGYMVFTAIMLYVRLPWMLCLGGAPLCLEACERFLRPYNRIFSLKIRRKPKPPKIRVIESAADQATGELLDERKKLVEERDRLESRLPAVKQRINELDAELNESDYREAPRGAKARTT